MKEKLLNFYNKLNIKKHVTVMFLILLILFIFIKRSLIAQSFSHTNIEDWKLIRSYLALFLSWPIIILIISLIFIFKFSGSLKIFLENIKSLRAGPLEISQHDKPSSIGLKEKMLGNLEEQGITLTTQQANNIEQYIRTLHNDDQNKEQLIKILVERSELYEFAYLNYFLVFNTKQALLWFNSISLKTSTKDNFIQGYFLSIQDSNILAEKEAIFNALLVNNLIEDTGQQTFKISEKGERFLEFIGLKT